MKNSPSRSTPKLPLVSDWSHPTSSRTLMFIPEQMHERSACVETKTVWTHLYLFLALSSISAPIYVMLQTWWYRHGCTMKDDVISCYCMGITRRSDTQWSFAALPLLEPRSIVHADLLSVSTLPAFLDLLIVEDNFERLGRLRGLVEDNWYC